MSVAGTGASSKATRCQKKVSVSLVGETQTGLMGWKRVERKEGISRREEIPHLKKQ